MIPSRDFEIILTTLIVYVTYYRIVVILSINVSFMLEKYMS